MVKRIISFGVMLLLMFSLAACNNGGGEVPDKELLEYKSSAKTEIGDYALDKGQENYTTENWLIILDIATKCKADIGDAVDKAAVDILLAGAKEEIEAVEQEGTNLEWTNDNAVYAFVKAGFESDILKDIEGAFGTLSFQKVYVIEKGYEKGQNLSTMDPLTLLFILYANGTGKQQEFIELLRQDERINHAIESRDLPFETVDTCYIDKAKDTVAVGETLTLEVRGRIDYYVQPFNFKGLLVKPIMNKTYTVADFPVDLESVEARENGWLYLELAVEDYFEVIKAADILSRLSTIEKVELDRSLLDWPPPPPPTWELSDYTIAEFVAGVQWDDYPKAVIRGLKVGKVTVDFDGVSCEITVI